MYTLLKELLEFPQKCKYKFDVNTPWPKLLAVFLTVVKKYIVTTFLSLCLFVIAYCFLFFIWIKEIKNELKLIDFYVSKDKESDLKKLYEK